MTVPLPALVVTGVTIALMMVLLAVVGWRRPLAGPFAVYAGAMTLGSAITLPGLPAPFNTPATVLGVIAAASIAGFLLLSQEARPHLHRSAAPFALLLGLAALTTFWSLDPGRTLRSVGYLGAVMLLFGLTIAVPVARRDLRAIETALILGGVATACYALWQLSQGAFGAEGDIPRLATVGSEGGPNATSAAMLLPLLVALGRADTAARRTGRLMAVIAAIVIAVTIVLAGSRGGIIGAVVAVALTIVIHPNRVRYLRIMLGLLLAAAIGFAIAPQGLIDHLQKRDSTGRAQIWEAGASACNTYCLTGSGYATFGDVYLGTLTRDPTLDGHRIRPYQAHNFVLNQAVELGVVGAFLTLLALWWILQDVGRLPRRLRGPPLAALIGLLVSNLFLSHFAFRYFWLVLTYAVLTVITDTPGHRDSAAELAILPVGGSRGSS